MAVAPKNDVQAVFALRSAALTLISFVLKTTDLAALAKAMEAQFSGAPALFEQDPVVIDLSALADETATLDFEALIVMLRARGMLPVAVRGGPAALKASALAAGLGEAPEGAPAAREAPAVQPVPAAPAQASAPPILMPRTMVVERPLRSGQQVYAKGCDLVLLGGVNFGAEVIADGHIHVYSALRGRAIAGARGDADARIFASVMEPQLVAIAGTYRTTETPLPPEVLAKAAQVRLDGERLVIEPLGG